MVPQIGLIHEPLDRLPVLRGPRQLAFRKRFQYLGTVHQRVLQQTSQPLLTHIGSLRLQRQRNDQLLRIGRTRFQHGRHRQRQLV